MMLDWDGQGASLVTFLDASEGWGSAGESHWDPSLLAEDHAGRDEWISGKCGVHKSAE